MRRRYLFGPVTSSFAHEKLRRQREAGDCRAFDPEGVTDVKIGNADTWEDVCQRFPQSWQPDYVVLNLPYATIPPLFETCPLPVVALAPEWSLLWHYYRLRLPQCDLVIIDSAGVKAFGKEGLSAATIPANLSGFARSFAESARGQEGRDIDILFLANLNAAVHPQRGSWLPRLAALAKDWHVVVQTGVFGAAYQAMLERARIVFSHNRSGGLYRRALEAAAAGALVFQEAGNPFIESVFQHGQECVYFNSDSLTNLLSHYLANEGERWAIAEAGRARVAGFSFEQHWEETCEKIDRDWPTLEENARKRQAPDRVTALLARTWQAISSPSHPDGDLLTDLERALAQQPGLAALHNARGLARGCMSPSEELGKIAGHTVEDFRRAAGCQPNHVVAQVNLAVALAFSGQRQAAIDQAQAVLVALNRLEEGQILGLAEGHFPPSFNWIRMEWERAAWSNVGEPSKEIDAKRRLVQWRLHGLLAELTGDLVHSYESYHAWPDLPPAQSVLGCSLARTGHPAEAIPYLSQALALNPLDRTTAFVLNQSLGAVGDRQGQQQLAGERRLLSKSAPKLIPLEEWFQEPVSMESLSGPPASDAVSVAPGPAAPTVIAPPREGAPHVSLSMIVKNEEANLPHCLASVADLVDEIVIVDTGSTDRTREIAAQFGAKVFEFAWIDSFGAARNESLGHVTGKWVLWLDGDDRIDEQNRQKLKVLFNQLGDEMDAYVVKIRSLLDSKRGDAKLLDQVRLFRNHPQVRWQYRIHEQILPSVNRLGGEVRWTDIVIDHAGYQDQEVRRRKLLRNLRLLELEDTENRDDPFTLFNLGWTTLDLGRADDALPLLQRSLELSSPNASIVRKLYVLLTHAHLQLNQPDKALEVCAQGSERFPEDAELLFEEASLLRQKGDLENAERRLIQLMNMQTGRYFASMDAGLRTHRARHLLGLIFIDQKKTIEAEAQFRAAIREKPDFMPALLGLGDLYLVQERWPMAEKLAGELDQVGSPLDAGVLRSRAFLARKEYDAARRVLETVLAQVPNFHGGWVLLSHVLISEAKDWGAAEHALRRILALNPANAEARHNLEVLLSQQARVNQPMASSSDPRLT